MNNDLISVESQQLAFDWDTTVAETRELVKEDAELTSTIEDAMMKRFQGRVKIGFNLIALQSKHSKHKHGDFTTQVLPELDINARFAQRCIGVANLYQNSIATRVSRLEEFDIPLPMNTWNKLASPSAPPVVIEQLLSGEIKATTQDIDKAIRRAEEAERAQKQAEEITQEAYRHVETVQEELFRLREQMADVKPEVEIRVVEKEVIPPEISEKLSKLENSQEQIKRLTYERDNEAARAETFAKKFQESLSTQRQEEANERIRQRWRSASNEFQSVLNRWYSQWPGGHETQVFETEDWARLENAQKRAQRFIEDCHELRQKQTMIVDAG